MLLSTPGCGTHRACSAMAYFVLYETPRESKVFVGLCTDLLYVNQTRVMCHDTRFHADLPLSPFLKLCHTRGYMSVRFPDISVIASSTCYFVYHV